MLDPDMIKLDALEFIWRTLQASPDFEAMQSVYARAFGSLMLAELSAHLREKAVSRERHFALAA